ncbi:hypothetical protein BH09GEM1_BH09GEM1_34540 [soil metagenome]
MSAGDSSYIAHRDGNMFASADARGRAAGGLLARTRSKDVVDAALVLLAVDGDEIVTSDVGDLKSLAKVAGRHVELIET